jgi:hypothetical protein
VENYPDKEVEKLEKWLSRRGTSTSNADLHSRPARWDRQQLELDITRFRVVERIAEHWHIRTIWCIVA